MGAKVQNATKDKKSYEDCVNSLREFSKKIQTIYVENGIQNALGDVENTKHRLVVYAGDEVNFVVNAHDAFDCAERYLDGLKADEDASACAGIAVFSSHAPYADAYRIAEECCETGKKLMKDKQVDNACFIDYHLIQGAAGSSLEDIRKHEATENSSRPWRIDEN